MITQFGARTQPGTTQIGRNMNRTQPGQIQPAQGHNPDTDRQCI